MNNIYDKDIVWDKKNEHYVHIDPSISTLKKIISIEGPQRILLYKDDIFSCTKAYDSTHYDMYNTLYDNNYLNYKNNNFGFLTETKLLFGGSIMINKGNSYEDEPDLPLYCKNFNLVVISGEYTNIDQAITFYNLLPNSLKNLLGELDIEECKTALSCFNNVKIDKTIDKTKDFGAFIDKTKEENIYLKQLSRYINEIDKLLNTDDSINISQLKLYVKLSKKAYMDYKIKW